MSTDLAVTNQETGITGDRDKIANMVERIRSMTTIPDDAPAQAVWGLAQMCHALDLNPIVGEAYLAKFNGKYAPLVATIGYEKEARRQSEFQTEVVRMDEMELRQHLGDLYTEDDVGIKITMWVLKDALKWKDAGLPYKPVINYGFWQRNATPVMDWDSVARKKVPTGEYKPDNIPKSWSKIQVAEKRALRNAMKKAYSFTGFEAKMQKHGALTSENAEEFEDKVYEVIEEQVHQEEVKTAPILQKDPGSEEDGVLFATPQPKQNRVGPENLEEVEEIQGEEPDVPFAVLEADPEEEQVLAESHLLPWFAVGNGDTDHDLGRAAELIFVLRNADKDSTTKMSGKEYGILTGAVTKAIGVKYASDYWKTYGPLLWAILLGREINKDNRPGEKVHKAIRMLTDSEHNGHKRSIDDLNTLWKIAIEVHLAEALWETN